MRKTSKKFSISSSITAMVLVMVVLSSVSIGVFSYIVYRNDSVRYHGQKAMAAAASMASLIDVAQFKYIAATEEQTDYYLQMKDIFTKANRNIGTLYLYSMVKDSDGINYKYVFAAVTDLNNPLLGGKDTIASYSDYALRAYDNGEQIISDIYDNQGYGFLVSAFYPLLDEVGAVVGLVCADVKADGVMESVNDYRDKVIIAVAVFILLFGIISVAYSLHLFGRARVAEQKSKKLAAIVSVADAGVVVKDKNGVITEWNIGAQNILGFKAEELIGETMHYYAPAEHHATIDDMDERLKRGEHITHVEIVRRHKEGHKIYGSVSYTPIFDSQGNFEGSVAIFHDISDKKQMELSLQKVHKSLLSSIEYASKIQKNLLPSPTLFEEAFEDYAVIWEPRDIVGGDIYWLKNFEEGTILCVCDCTGHGTPGALLTVFVVSALESFVNETNYKDTANVIFELDRRLVSALNSGATSKDIKDGCDLAVLFISKSGEIKVSSGNMRVLVCDGNTVTQLRGQNLFVGEGRLKNKEDIDTITVPANPANKFYIASDGLFDQTGGDNGLPLGYKKVMKLILEHHCESQASIAKKIWGAFERYRGEDERMDDFELITFKSREE